MAVERRDKNQYTGAREITNREAKRLFKMYVMIQKLRDRKIHTLQDQDLVRAKQGIYQALVRADRFTEAEADYYNL